MTSAKVGHKTYTIAVVPEVRGPDGSLLIGDTNESLARIRLADSLPPCVLRETLLHELLHTILDNSGHWRTSEGVIDALANGLLTFFDDNEELTDALLRGSDSGRALAGLLCAGDPR